MSNTNNSMYWLKTEGERLKRASREASERRSSASSYSASSERKSGSSSYSASSNDPIFYRHDCVFFCSYIGAEGKYS